MALQLIHWNLTVFGSLLGKYIFFKYFLAKNEYRIPRKEHSGNWIFLREQNQPLKYCHSHETVVCFLGVLDLSMETLKDSVGQRAAKFCYINF